MTLASPRCSDAARERGDDPAGTAAPAQRWLLVEHPGPWAVDAWAGSGVEPRVRRQLDDAARAARARIQLVRRPGRDQGTGRRAWAVLASDPEETGGIWGTWDADEDLLAAVPALAGKASDGDLRRAHEPLLLVCTHGRHDTCCAVRGRPVAAALQRFWPEQTWETSHVGGDRFAATLVVLPGGTYYGNLDDRAAVDVVSDHLAGRVTAEHLRGFSNETPVAQVAVVEAHRRYGPAPVGAFTSTAVREVTAGRFEVRLRGRAPCPADLVVVVETFARPPALLTCRAPAATSATGYRVTDVRPV